MKKITFILLSCVSVGAFAQKDNVGIGTTNPDPSAALEVNSNNKGLLMPRLSLQQRNSIQNPAKGLIVYQTDMLSGFYFYDGAKWQPLASNNSEKSVAADPNDWTMDGNTNTTATSFIGTTAAAAFHPITIKVGGIQSGYLTGSPIVARTLFGYSAGENNTGNFNTAIGFQTLKTGSGSYNTAIGYQALGNGNVTGGSNVAIGNTALRNNTSGRGNMAIGGDALVNNTSGEFNSAIGVDALVANQSGSGNTAIGQGAGSSSLGSYNVYIGNQAGGSETGSNKLYIANSNTVTPLVYGDFSAKFVAIGDVTATLAKRDNLASQYGLLVQKGILTEKIKVATMSTSDWSDYVFEEGYKRMSLDDVEAFIKENKHLPNVPTTEEMIANGNDIQKTDAKLLEKIEELTLYLIEINKQIKELKAENQKLRNK